MQTFETRSAFEVPISETHEWHSNIRMQDGETFECIRMHIPSTCGVLHRSDEWECPGMAPIHIPIPRQTFETRNAFEVPIPKSETVPLPFEWNIQTRTATRNGKWRKHSNAFECIRMLEKSPLGGGGDARVGVLGSSLRGVCA